MPLSFPPRLERTPLERQILEHAEEQMLACGTADLRVGDVVAEVGTSTGTIYNLFGSKSGLIAAVLEEICGDIFEYTGAPLARGEAAAWSQLLDLCVGFERVVRSDSRRLLLVGRFLTDDADLGPLANDARQRLLAGLGTIFLATAELIEALVRAEVIRPVEHFSTAGWVYSSLAGAAMTISHMPPWMPADAPTRAAVFRTQRQMLAQALLSPAQLDDRGLAPRAYWDAPRPR